MARSRYVSAADESAELKRLEQQLREYYTHKPYHDVYIRGINADWRAESHPAQIELCKRLGEGSRVLEIGCGDGSAARELRDRVAGMTYVGIDLNPAAWVHGQFSLAVASATAVPFRESSFDAVVSMYVLEHVVYPHKFLSEAWRVLRRGGLLLLISPDFRQNAMASERIGFSYGSGRDKLKRGRILDALLTAYDTRFRIARIRKRHQTRVLNGHTDFPILLEPRCLQLEGFVPDCDAVYPSTPDEVTTFLRTEYGATDFDLFYRDGSTFGMQVRKT